VYEVIGQSFDDFAKTRTVVGAKEARKAEEIKDK
jgi:ribosomal protein S19